MRTLAIGDVHGCLRALLCLLKAADISGGDQLVFLGDYVDRGPDSRGVVEWLIAAQRERSVVTLLGNHEAMILEARGEPGKRSEWKKRGGRETLLSYSRPGVEARLEEIPEEHWDFFGACVASYETEAALFVHGNAYSDMALEEQPGYMTQWESFATDYGPHRSGKLLVCGHSAQRSGLPRYRKHSVCIDTRVYGARGWLSCLDVQSRQYWQANQAGEERSGWLDELQTKFN